MAFRTEGGVDVPAVTAEQMREVDRIAVEDFGLGILQMMENAGRNLALNVIEMIGAPRGAVTVLAGAGGNGGGGICCARHLHNRGFAVSIILDRAAGTLTGAAKHQLNILHRAGLEPTSFSEAGTMLRDAQIVVDALVGYGLRGAPMGRTAELIERANQRQGRVVSLDVPSGLNSTTGATPGVVVRAARTLTLALPKTGLHTVPGDLYLADIGIPPEVYHALDIHFEPFFGDRYWLRLVTD